MQRRFGWAEVVTLIVAAVIMGLTVAQAIRETGRCRPRGRRRSERRV
jgi:hypothetical protein